MSSKNQASEGKNDQADSNPGSRTDATGDSGYVYKEPERIPLVLDEYNMKHESRGVALLINNHHFDYAKTNQYDREGTDVDAQAMETVLMRMGFDVMRFDDMRSIEMTMKMKEISRMDHSKYDCFACVILSHGDNGVVFGTDGRCYIDSLIQPMKGDNCPSLAGKPKLFFIQACRGKKFDWGVDVDEVDAAPSETQSVRKIPIEADILMAYSVVPGYFSWRNNFDGSWFVQAIARVFEEFGDTKEILQLMTLVNKVVAYEFASCTDDEFSSDMKQVPCFVSTLTKELYFRPKY